MIIEQLFTQPALFFVWLLAIIYALTVHEFSHALAGDLQGDDTARSQGRLTLNPMAHIEWFGLIFLLLAGFGWGRPVPFNPFNLRNKRFGPFLVALAGPFANLLSVVIFGFALKLLLSFTALPADNLLILFLFILVQLNLVLFLFNLIPLPPLDGSKIWSVIAPDFFERIGPQLERMGPIILLAILFMDAITPVSFLGALFQWASNIVFGFFL